MNAPNVDEKTVSGFGREWSRFDQSELDATEKQKLFDEYFGLIEWASDAAVLDMGCGTGRWAALVAPRCGTLIAADASEQSVAVARRNLEHLPNVKVIQATTESNELPQDHFDLIYSLGVLHHLPDTTQAIRDLAQKLKPSGQILLYIYYAFDNRAWWFRAIWRCSDLLRRMIASLPFAIRAAVCDIIAALIYWPLARAAKYLKLGEAWPLSVYRDRSFYTMRTDALDRFGTKLEQRFTQAQIKDMMMAANLIDIQFSPNTPYWVAWGRRK